MFGENIELKYLFNLLPNRFSRPFPVQILVLLHKQWCVMNLKISNLHILQISGGYPKLSCKSSRNDNTGNSKIKKRQ